MLYMCISNTLNYGIIRCITITSNLLQVFIPSDFQTYMLNRVKMIEVLTWQQCFVISFQEINHYHVHFFSHSSELGEEDMGKRLLISVWHRDPQSGYVNKLHSVLPYFEW